MTAQDDQREHEMILRFNLVEPANKKRSGIDACLDFQGRHINFELKSTTKDTVSTVRDMGPDHIAKWRDGLHWIFAFYDATGTRMKYCIYASPSDMEPWIAEKEHYILPDQVLGELLPKHVTREMVYRILGKKEVYTLDDAKWIMKKQWTTESYKANQDVAGGYSVDKMLEILRLRSEYVISRGSTLNNPHIEKSFFDKFERITDNHAVRLRELLTEYYSS